MPRLNNLILPRVDLNLVYLGFLGSIILLNSNSRITLLGPKYGSLGMTHHWAIKNWMPFLGVYTH